MPYLIMSLLHVNRNKTHDSNRGSVKTGGGTYYMDHEICVFSLSPYANVNDEVNKLNELMKKLGGSAKIITNGDYRGLVIDWDPTKLSRNAGKKRKWSKYYCTYSDVEEMRASGMKDKDIADRLGMSLRTFYRRMQLYTSGQADSGWNL